MKIVTVNGVTYLGTLEETEAGIVLTEAMKFNGPVTQSVITEYYKKGNVGKLQNPTFGGSGISYTVDDVDDDVVMFAQIAQLALKQAKKVAIANLENREFDGVLGKL